MSQKRKEEEKKIKKIASTCGKIVQKEYWKSIKKILMFKEFQMIQKQDKEDKKKKLENLVSKQLKLSSKMANFLKNDSIDNSK